MLVIGSGPAGQKAAIQAAKVGKSVALIEMTRELGGCCVQRGTIPSKTLRENALRVKNMRSIAELSNFKLAEHTELATLIDRLDEVLAAHDHYMRRQLQRNQIQIIHGRARFISPTQVEIEKVRGDTLKLNSEHIVIATGSFPRQPANIDIDHEHLFDSDSILSMLYLPKSLIVLGGGVIASEYASIFQALGVAVTMIDKYPTPLGFLDEDLTEKFVEDFIAMGGTWEGNRHVTRAHWNGCDAVVVECQDGSTFSADKLLCAAGRMANVEHLAIENAGLSTNDAGLISVDERLCTSVPTIYAAGDVIGPPSLASASMEQGRRASRNAYKLKTGDMQKLLPSGIYSIPELSAVGLSEKQARAEHNDIIVGRADFSEIARGQISGIQNGMLKIICDAQGEYVLGVQIVGEGATELIHIGQMAIVNKATVDIFVDCIFNFPTLAEAYRVAALEVIGARR